jgi:molybdenum-dependent DNA-binding transcriptional regulator ModE
MIVDCVPISMTGRESTPTGELVATLQALDEHGTYQKTGKALFVCGVTVYKRVEDLERRTGLKLVTRPAKRGFYRQATQLTKHGRDLICDWPHDLTDTQACIDRDRVRKYPVAAKYVLAGMSVKEVSEKQGCSMGVVYRLLRSMHRLGIASS